jgi:hypothetical protein
MCQILSEYYKKLTFLKIIELELPYRSAQGLFYQAKQDFELLLTDCRLSRSTGL